MRRRTDRVTINGLVCVVVTELQDGAAPASGGEEARRFRAALVEESVRQMAEDEWGPGELSGPHPDYTYTRRGD